MQFTIATASSLIAIFALIQGSTACSSGCSQVTNTQNRSLRSLAVRAATPAEWPAKLSACFQGDGTAPPAKVVITGTNSAEIDQLSAACMTQVETYSVADAMQFGTITPLSSTSVKVSNVPAEVFQHLKSASGN
jgi:hypothetical protein